MAVTSSEKNSKQTEKDRLLKELEHLEKAQKSGILPLQEYASAKKTLEKKLLHLEQKRKQAAAKEKAVKDILGDSSLLGSSQKSTSLFSKKEKKTEKEKKSVVSQDSSNSAHHEKIYDIPQKVVLADKSEKFENKDVDAFVEQENTNWQFALAILTLFLLILLYVKFTSFGTVHDVLIVDAYLDTTSQYSKEMHAVLTTLSEEYQGTVWVEYHLVGISNQSILVGTAVLCANQQERGREYTDFLFLQEISMESLNMPAIASSLCLRSLRTLPMP